MVTVEVGNNLRHAKFTETVREIVASVVAGNVVTVENSGEFAVAVTEAVEAAKRELIEQGQKVYQANRLVHEDVLAATSASDPLAKSKVHHSKIKFRVRLSTSPFDIEDGESQQLLEPSRKHPVRSKEVPTMV